MLSAAARGGLRAGVPALAGSHGRRKAKRERRARQGLWLAAVWAMSFLFTSDAAAQVVWEYSPYNVEVWVGFAPAPEFTPRFEEETRLLAEQLAEIEIGAPWTVSAIALPAHTRAELLAYLEMAADPKLKSLPRPEAELRRVLERDKLLVVDVESSLEGYFIRARELDCRTRTWGHVVEKTAWQQTGIPYVIFSACVEAFVPLARVEAVKDKEAAVRLRAGGLLFDPPLPSGAAEGQVPRSSPARVADGSIWRPIVRRNDRYGEPRPGGTQPAPWTFLRVTSQSGALLTCELISGVRGVLGGRSNQRNERLALLVRPQGESTRVVLRSNAPSRVPLVGYEIYEPGESEQRSKLLGVTDWRGAIEVSRGDSPLRMLIVKSGGQLLARLPLVPGLAAEEFADMPDDQKRLAAEGAVTGLNSSFLDVVARRQVLAVRIRRKIAAQDYPAAQTLIDELRVLDSRTNLSERLDQYQRDYTSPDNRVQIKIDKMFSETRALLNKHLDMRLPDQLTGELAKAKGGRS